MEEIEEKWNQTSFMTEEGAELPQWITDLHVDPEKLQRQKDYNIKERFVIPGSDRPAADIEFIGEPYKIENEKFKEGYGYFIDVQHGNMTWQMPMSKTVATQIFIKGIYRVEDGKALLDGQRASIGKQPLPKDYKPISGEVMEGTGETIIMEKTGERELLVVSDQDKLLQVIINDGKDKITKNKLINLLITKKEMKLTPQLDNLIAKLKDAGKIRETKPEEYTLTKTIS